MSKANTSKRSYSEIDYESPENIRAFIDQLIDDKSLPIYRGTISRARFSEIIGAPSLRSTSSLLPSSKFHLLNKILKEYDEKLYDEGVIGTVWELKVPEIEECLEELKNKGELPVNDLGTLNKRKIMMKFGFAENMSTAVAEKRAPKLKNLFSKYSKYIEDNENYSQYKGDKFVADLKKLLEGDVVLYKSKRIISYKWIKDILGIEKSTLINTPKLKELIDKKTKEIHDGQKRGKTAKSFSIYGAATINCGATPYSKIHDRVFDFSTLIELYGLEFAEKIGTAYLAISSKMASPKQSYLRTLHFLSWLPEYHPNIQKYLINKSKIDRFEYERACLEYKQELISVASSNAGLTGNQKIKPYLGALTHFSEAGILPSFTFPKDRTRNNRDSTHRASVLEATHKDEYKAAELILTDAAKYRGIELDDGKDTKLFIETLLKEKEIFEDTPSDLPEAMLEIAERRVSAIKVEATKIVNQWIKKRNELGEVISHATHTADYINNNFQFLSINRRNKAWRMFIEEVFPKHQPKITLANLLIFISDAYNCVCPSSKDGVQFWNKQYCKVGGIKEVQSYLLPTRDVVSSGATLYLCESGSNVAVGLSLENNCISKSETSGHSKITGIKDRANSKPIYSDLKNTSKENGVVSFLSFCKYLSDANKVIWDGSSYNKKRLFVYAEAGEVKELQEYNFRADFKDICNESNYLKKLNLTPSMLRPTILLDVQLKNPNDLGVAQVIAHHENSSTTFGYTGKLPFRILLEKQITGFMKTVEIVISKESKGKLEALNVSSSEWEESLSKIQATGLGVFCKDRKIADVNGKEEECSKVDECVQCKHDRMLIVADTNSISKMLLWKESLELNEKEWLAERYDRWMNIWMPWLALFKVVLDEKMSRGSLLKIKNNAKQNVSILKDKSNFTLPKPW